MPAAKIVEYQGNLGSTTVKRVVSILRQSGECTTAQLKRMEEILSNKVVVVSKEQKDARAAKFKPQTEDEKCVGKTLKHIRCSRKARKGTNTCNSHAGKDWTNVVYGEADDTEPNCSGSECELQQCQAQTAAGFDCSKMAQSGSNYCGTHINSRKRAGLKV